MRVLIGASSLFLYFSFNMSFAVQCVLQVPPLELPVETTVPYIPASDYWGYPGGGPFTYADGYEFMEKGPADGSTVYSPFIPLLGGFTQFGNIPFGTEGGGLKKFFPSMLFEYEAERSGYYRVRGINK